MARPPTVSACVAKVPRSCRQLQKIRLSSDWANPLKGSRNGRVDGDGCVEFAADAGVAHGLQDGVIRQQVIEQLMRQLMHYDAEFRREEATFAVGSQAKH